VRKNAKKYIELKCEKCGNLFKKALKTYKYKIKKGQTKFYCVGDCAKKNRADELSPLREILRQSLKVSKTRNREHNLTLEFLKELWDSQKGICPYTKKEMILSGFKKHVLHSASLDRIDSSKGYVKGNVEFVCLFINLGKNGFTKDEVKEFLQRIVT
jgi:hypothetical protein